MMQQYKHRRLDLNSSQIRLLRFERAADEASIVLSLRHVTLEDGDPFNALSYAWGEDEAIQEILIRDGNEIGLFSIRPNLYDFLTTARNSLDDWAAEWFWVDQICIDQSHHEERCHQVAQMAKLYSSALATIVWPGVISPMCDLNSLDAVSSTSLFDTLVLESIQSIPVTLGTGLTHWASRLPSRAAVRLLSLITPSMLELLVDSTYWSRLWIIQEIALASRVHVVIAGQIWELEDFHVTVLVLTEHQNRAKSVVAKRISVLLELLKIRLHGYFTTRHQSSAATAGLQRWSWAFILAFETKCKIPIDQVYGIMALVDEDLRVHPDYTISHSQLLRAILEKQLSFPSSGQNIWIILFDIIRHWTNTLHFEPLETIRDEFAEGLFLHLRQPSAVEFQTVKNVVQRVLKHFELPCPTIVLDPYQCFVWSTASKIVYLAFKHEEDVEVIFRIMTGTDPAACEAHSDEASLLHWTLLQQRLIQRTEAQNSVGPQAVRPKTLLRRNSFPLTTNQIAEDVSRDHSNMSRRNSMPDVVSDSGGAIKISSNLPDPLIELLLIGFKSENSASKYDRYTLGVMEAL